MDRTRRRLSVASDVGSYLQNKEPPDGGEVLIEDIGLEVERKKKKRSLNQKQPSR